MTSAESAGTKILLIDDEPGFTEPMVFWLKSRGYAAYAANDPVTGVKMIKEDPPDLVFLDLNMPVMDGIEAMRKIRQFNRDIPIIIISAYVDKLRLTEASRYGVSGVFYKGDDFEKGVSLIQFAIRSHKGLKK